MRNAFINALLNEARNDPSIILLVGDLGFGVVEDFAKELPKQFVNFGINEQSMVSAAAGLAREGFKPYVYSIGNFPTFRALEQIRNDVCFMNLEVTIVAIGAGFAYGTAGYSHHLVEDISAMSPLPNLRIYSPADSENTRTTLKSMLQYHGPKYIRLGKGSEPEIMSEFTQIQENVFIQDGSKEIAIMSTGQILNEVLIARDKLGIKGHDPTLIHLSEVSESKILGLVSILDCKQILTVEEHILRGGFGSMVLETLDSFGSYKIYRMGISAINPHFSGSQQHLRNLYQIDSNAIARRYRSILEI
jgi:transketolase